MFTKISFGSRTSIKGIHSNDFNWTVSFATRSKWNKTTFINGRKLKAFLSSSASLSNSQRATNEDIIIESSSEILKIPREVDVVDVLIVGAGPSGLSASIRIKQLDPKLRVLVIEKGSEVGAHTLSGAVLEPRSLNELIPEWKEKGAPLHVPVKEDGFFYLTERYSLRLPTPPAMRNDGNFIVSLGNVVRWLGKEAESMGVEIYSGVAGKEVLYNETDGSVMGVATNDVGIGKDGKPTANFQRGMELRAKVTLFAEGCRGSLSKKVMERFRLTEGCSPQTYGIGIKELWEVKPENFHPGKVVHTIGWPVDYKTWGGSFIYHWEKNQVMVGCVIGLDYENPYLNPYKEFQRWKTHSLPRALLEGGRVLQYGARALNEGGFQALPRSLAFPGGAFLGCAAGMLNVPKIKGAHCAIKSGMLAAEAIAEKNLHRLEPGNGVLLQNYDEYFRKSWVYEELYRARNIHPSFHYGLYGGLAYSAIDTYLLRGKAPWTFRWSLADHSRLKKANECKPIEYPKPDGKLSFDLMTSVSRSNTNHNENQPPHLKVKNQQVAIDIVSKQFASPETRYCPAGVYELAHREDGSPYLQVNAQNCLHCKTCDIKDPRQNLEYTVPEGGGGPAYSCM